MQESTDAIPGRCRGGESQGLEGPLYLGCAVFWRASLSYV